VWTIAFSQSPLRRGFLYADDHGLTGSGAFISSICQQSLGDRLAFSVDESHGGLLVTSTPDILSLVLRGNLTNVNETLNTISVIPAPDWSGIVNVAVWIRDGGIVGDPQALEAMSAFNFSFVPVNDAPFLTWEGQRLADSSSFFTTQEDVDVALDRAGPDGTSIPGLRIVDVDAGAASMLSLNLVVEYGGITYHDSSISPFTLPVATVDEAGNSYPDHGLLISKQMMTSNVSQINMNGTLTGLNAMLSKLIYKPALDWHGEDEIAIDVCDNGHFGGDGVVLCSHTSLKVLVTSVNDAPIITMNGTRYGHLHDNTSTWEVPTKSILEDTLTPITGLRVDDADADDVTGDRQEQDRKTFNMLQLNVTVHHGKVSCTSLGRSVILEGSPLNGSRNVVVRGDLASLNEVLSSLYYLADDNWFGVDLMTLFVDDLGNSGNGGALNHTQYLVLQVLQVYDPPSVILPAGGYKSAGYLSVFEDVVGVIGADCCNWDDKAELFANGSWRVISADGIQIVDADVAPKTPRRWKMPGTNAYIRYDLDTDGTNGTSSGVYEVTVEVAHGTLTLNRIGGINFTQGDGHNDQVMTFKGSVDDVNRALLGASYLSHSNWNSGKDLPNGGSRGAKEFETIKITVTDEGNSSDTATLYLDVQPSNDAPTLAFLPGFASSQQAQEGTPFFITGLSVGDVDIEQDSGELLQVTIYASNGTVSINDKIGVQLFTEGSGVRDKVIAFKASLADTNRALASLVYQNDPQYYGPDAIIIGVEDLGNNGLGPACRGLGQNCNLMSSITIPLRVNPSTTRW